MQISTNKLLKGNFATSQNQTNTKRKRTDCILGGDGGHVFDKQEMKLMLYLSLDYTRVYWMKLVLSTEAVRTRSFAGIRCPHNVDHHINDQQQFPICPYEAPDVNRSDT